MPGSGSPINVECIIEPLLITAIACPVKMAPSVSEANVIRGGYKYPVPGFSILILYSGLDF